jgi:nitrogenase molybdenum-iron protein alpha/beta subunit
VPTYANRRTKKRQSLTLHVRAHESTGAIVVLKERNASGGNRDNLLRRDVDVIDEFLSCKGVLVIVTGDDFVIEDFLDELGVATTKSSTFTGAPKRMLASAI